MSISYFADIITYLSPLILFIGVLIGGYYYKSLDKINRLLFFYLIANLTVDVYSRIAAEITNNNLISFVVWSFLELILFSMFYLNFIKKKIVIWSLISVGVIYMVVEFMYFDTSTIISFQSYAKVVTSVFIVTFVLFYFFEQLKEEDHIPRSSFYLHSMILCYFALELLLLLPMNFLINSSSYLIFYVWFARIILLLVFYSYLISFIWKNGKNQRQLHYGL